MYVHTCLCTIRSMKEKEHPTPHYSVKWHLILNDCNTFLKWIVLKWYISVVFIANIKIVSLRKQHEKEPASLVPLLGEIGVYPCPKMKSTSIDLNWTELSELQIALVHDYVCPRFTPPPALSTLLFQCIHTWKRALCCCFFASLPPYSIHQSQATQTYRFWVMNTCTLNTWTVLPLVSFDHTLLLTWNIKERIRSGLRL